MSPILSSNPTAIALFIVALIWMFYLAIKDHKSLKENLHVDQKSVIVSIGVLGTFIGIFIGLWEFDTNSIDKSVPLLLEGLKLAFATSIGGMTISVVLSTMQRDKVIGGSDELSTLVSMDKKLSGLDEMNEQVKGLRLEIRDEQKTTRTQIEKAVDSISKLAAEDSINNFRIEVHEEQLKGRTFLEEQFTATNDALEKAIEVLSKGATEEIIKALENVIADFNKNLVDQFGDNFKQLNEAVLNLVKWQEQFKDIVEKDHGLLVEIRGSLDDSGSVMKEIASRNDDVRKVYEQLQSIINTYDVQVSSLNKQLEEYGNLGEKATEAFGVLSNGFEKVQSGMGEQSEAIAQLTKDISTQLPKSLGELENTLVGLTDQFGKDYKSFLDNYRSLVSQA